MDGSTAPRRPALGERKLWRDAAAIAVCATGLLVLALGAAILPHGRGWGFDFRAYYQAATRLAEFGTPYDPALLSAPFSPGPQGLYLYSPLPALALQPLTALPAADATAAWFALRVGLLVLACLLMPITLRLRLAMVGLAALSAPVLLDLSLGNVSLIVTFLTVVAWRFLDRPLGALAIAASLFVRPTMALFIGWWLVRGRLQVMAWVLLGAGALVLLSLPLIGVQPYLDYITLLGNIGAVMGVPNNVDLGSTALRLGAPQPLAWLALVGGVALAVGASLVSLRRDRELSFVVVSMAVLFVAPLLWEHYLTQLLIPAAFLASRGRPWGLALPLLAWVSMADLSFGLPFIGLAGMLLPLLAPARPGSLPPAGLHAVDRDRDAR